jgi:hypothetical protein
MQNEVSDGLDTVREDSFSNHLLDRSLLRQSMSIVPRGRSPRIGISGLYVSRTAVEKLGIRATG